MALSQTHIDIRSQFANKLADLRTEAASLDSAVARRTAIGNLSASDGGATSTGEIAVAVSALSELLDDTAGNSDFGGVVPVFSSVPIVGGNLSTTRVAAAVVSDLLPSPSIKLRPAAAPDSSTDINVSAWATLTGAGTTLINGIRRPLFQITLGTIPAGARAAFNASYKIVVNNPLDTRAGEVVSASSATYSYAG